MEDQYNNFKREFTIISDHINEYESFIQMLNKMRTYRFSVDQLVNQVNPHIEVNKNLQNQLKQNIQSYENDLREFTICILVDNEKRIYLSRRNNPTKDFYGKYQVPGGGKKNNESYDQCAKRETKEETDVEIHELDLVTIHQGFRVFPDGKECMFKCAIYFALIGNQIPKQVEASNNDEWFSVELRDLGKYDLTDSLKEFKSIIVEKINSKFRSIKSKDRKKKDSNKKRKIDQVYKSDNPSIVPSEDEIEILNRPSEEEILDNISKLVD
ncbi:NUDIX hydrolase domain-like protein [Gigaspora rosea]|uniref:NUDIX hydrolase domain-like protein n=1 Tax=Gigaspora rosea TaxID=44941 RepID=A0A397VPS4_9GLOM|nr:NUDIX hydrolase domain-like protein [Gigaspora rosea]